MNLKIPGLIANKKENSKLTSEELQAKRDSFEDYIKNWKSDKESQLSYDQQFKEGVEKISALTNTVSANSNLGVISSNGLMNYVVGIDPYGQNLNIPLPMTPNWEWKNPGPFRPGKINTDSERDYKDYARQLQEMSKPKKSEFEVLLDSMFDTSEKEQFLITLGFEFLHENSEDWIQRTVAGLTEKCKKSDCFEKTFLREMTIKFKNLLISKNSLKMKL